MSIQARIADLKSQTTPDAAIAAYGRFVAYYDTYEATLKARVAKSRRRDWSNDRIALSRVQSSPSTAHRILAERYGRDTMYAAIDQHPFH